ncbi:hypothetical protein MTO96_014500 [Rhipicephalus appendiculatus]
MQQRNEENAPVTSKLCVDRALHHGIRCSARKAKMAALVEGSQYGLSSQGNYSKNKTLIFVKLTDSALRSIEEYLKYKGGCTQKPSIQFEGNQGVITVPRPSQGGPAAALWLWRRKVKVKRPQLSVPPRQPSSSPPRITFGKPTGQNHNLVSTNESRSGIVRRSYRERVIHLLALRPYKKPELLARLMKEGIKEQDRKGLSAVLSQVAVLKDNSYCLARHAWNQVCDDWPYYTPEEQELVKRMRPHNLTPPSENGHHSPPAHNPTSRTSPSVQKREPCPEPPIVCSWQQAPKDQPLYQRCCDSATTLEGSCGVHVGQSAIPGSSPDSRDSGDLHATGVSSATPSPRNSTNQVPEYVTKYTEITSEEQRGRYKADFNAEYEEYKALHSTIESVSKRFTDLEDCLRTAREGSEQWNRVKQQIMREYEESKRDQRYQQARRKFQYLHDKLAHIKRLVMDYDSRSHNLPKS